MTIKVEQYQDLFNAPKNKVGNNKYLFFKSPPEFYVSEGEETHDIILLNSRRKPNVIVSAGFVTEEYDMVSVLPWGSTNLNIGPSDPKPVLVFLKNLPGAKGKSIEGV